MSDPEAPAQQPDEQAPALPEEARPVLVHCAHCHTDISRVCLGAIVRTMQGVQPYVLVPLRCPECNAPLLAIGAPPRIITPPS